MARLWTTGAETGHYLSEGIISVLNSAGISVQSTDKVSGAFAFELTSGAGNVATAIEFAYSGALDRDFYLRSRVKIVNTPTASAPILSFLTSASALIVSVRASTGGQFQVWNETGTPAQLGSDLGAYNNTTWYRVGLHVRIPTGGGANSTVEVRLNGTTVYSASNIDLGSTAPEKVSAGWRAAPGASKIIRLDDVALNDSTGSVNNSWLGDGHTIMLKPTADSARGSLWTGGAGGTTNLWDAVNNTPPVGLASASATNTSQIEHSGGTAQDYDATMQTYTVGGVGASDIVNVVFGVVSHGEDIATGSKTVNFSVVSNPAIAAGTAFDVGAAAVGTWATNWGNTIGAIAQAPSVTKGTAPVMRVSRPGTESRTASFALMGLMVEYEAPGPAALEAAVAGMATATASALILPSAALAAAIAGTSTVTADLTVSGGGGGGTPPSIAGTPQNGSDISATGSFNVTLDANVTGQYALIGIGSSGGSINTPSGWTAITPNADIANPTVYGFYRKLDGSEGTTIAMTKSGTQNVGWVTARIDGADATTFMDVTETKASDALATATSLAQSITPTTNQTLILGLVSVNSGSTAITPPGSWTEQAESTAGRVVEMATIVQATAGVVNGTWTWASGRATAGILIAIRPAGGGGGAAALAAAISGTSAVTADLTPGIHTYRWYTDATPDGSMTALAGGNATPTLTGAQTMNGIVRLRVQLTATATLQAEYSVDGTNWADIPNADNSGVTSGQNRWFTWANGAATAGATIGTQLLAGTQASGTYIESRGATATVSGGNRTEFDLAFKVRWPPPETTILIRLLDSATPITLPATIQLTTCAASARLYTIAKATPAVGGGQNREVNHGPWPRFFWDNTNWWTQTIQPQTADHDVVLYRYDNPGWTAFTQTIGSTSIATTSEADVKHNADLKVISSTPVLYVGAYPSGGAISAGRFTIASGTPTLRNTTTVQASRPGTHTHIAIDQGTFVWVVGLNGTTGLWAKRSTTADDGTTGFSPTWGTQLSLTETVTAGDIVKILPLASNRVLVLWAHGTKIRSCELTNAGFGTPQDASATADINPGDWDASLIGTTVYLIHSDTNGTGGTWKTRTYNTGTNTWSNGTDPGAAQPTQNSNADGLVTVPDGTDLYVFGTTIGTEGNQDRTITAVKFSGGAWTNLGTITPAGGRGNGDDIAGPIAAANSQIPIIYLHGDCDVSGMPFTYEVHILTLAATLAATITGTSSATATTLLLTHALASAIAGTSTTSALRLVLNHPLAAAVAGTSTTAASTLTLNHAMAASVAGTSAVTADLSVAGSGAVLAATVTGTSTVTASRLTLNHALVSGIVGTSAGTASGLNLNHALASAVVGTSTVAASRLTLTHALAAACLGTSVVSGTLSLPHALTAAVNATSNATASSIQVGHPLSAAVVGTSTVTGDVSVAGSGASLVAAISGTSAVAASGLRLNHALAAAIFGTSTTAATRITLNHPLVAAITGTSSVSASLGGDILLSAAIVGTSSASATRLTVNHVLAAQIFGTSAVTASNIRITAKLAAAVMGTSTMSADLLGFLLIPRLTATVRATGVLQGNIRVARPLGGVITHPGELEGSF